MGGEKMLCNRIKQFRTYNKLETEDLAKALNIEHSEYLKIESGEVIPNIEIITSLASIYKVTVNEFYGNEPRLTLHNENAPFNSATPDEFNVLKFAELSIDEKELILAYRTSKNKERFFKATEDEEN